MAAIGLLEDGRASIQCSTSSLSHDSFVKSQCETLSFKLYAWEGVYHTRAMAHLEEKHEWKKITNDTIMCSFHLDRLHGNNPSVKHMVALLPWRPEDNLKPVRHITALWRDTAAVIDTIVITVQNLHCYSRACIYMSFIVRCSGRQNLKKCISQHKLLDKPLSCCLNCLHNLVFQCIPSMYIIVVQLN